MKQHWKNIVCNHKAWDLTRGSSTFYAGCGGVDGGGGRHGPNQARDKGILWGGRGPCKADPK